MRKRFFAALTSVLLAAGLLVAGGVPASACASNCTQAQDYIVASTPMQQVQSTLTVTSPFSPPHDTMNDHWVGIQNSGGSYLVQAGYDWLDNAATGYTTDLQVWYQFYNTTIGCPEVLLFESDKSGSQSLGFIPFAGDTISFHLWYNSTYNAWGLNITDNNIPATWSHYIYPAQTNICNGDASLFKNPVAIIATENHLSSGLDLMNDGTETYKQPQASTSPGGAMTLFDLWLPTGNESSQVMIDGSGNTMESVSKTDTNGYAYQQWVRAN